MTLLPAQVKPAKYVLVLLVAIFVATGKAQDSNSAVEQSRLYQQTFPPQTVTPGTNDNASITTGGEQSDDESFGAQQIIKSQERPPAFYLGADASTFYTNNVALTRRNTISDGFFVGDAAFGWAPRVSADVQVQAGVRMSIFRYFNTSALDFEDISPGFGLVWAPSWARGTSLSARYDFTELLDRHSDELLEDHEFSFALQKAFVLGRSHAIIAGIVGSAGISDPYAQQRDQIGFGIAYHLQLTRQFDADVSYRHSWYFYNSGGRTDLNQVGSLGLHYHFKPWVSLDGFVSAATNYSTRSVFKYDVISTGGGVGLTIHF